MLSERDRELAVVDQAIAAAIGGDSALIAFTGPVGIGRSALLNEAAGRAGVRVLRATAARMEQSFAGGVIRQLCEPLLPLPGRSEADSTNGELARWLTGDGSAVARLFTNGFDPDPTTSAPSSATSSEASSRAASRGLATRLHGLWSLLAVLSAAEPLLIVVDDLQWTDEESLRLLAYLTNRWAGLRVLVLVAVLDGDPREEHPLVDAVLLGATESIALAPLSRAGTVGLLRQAHAKPQPEFVDACVEAGAGNPLLLRSIMTSVAQAGYGTTADAVEAVFTRCDATTRERIATCLRHQPERTRALAGAVAVLAAPTAGSPAGSRVSVHAELIAELAGLDPIGYAQAVLDLDRLGLFGSVDPVPIPVHPAVREAALSLLTVAELESRHEHAAELLRVAGRPAEEVAAQLMRVTRCTKPWVRPVLQEAAVEALRRSAPRDAAGYLRRALLSAPLEGTERGRLLLDLSTTERGFAPADAELHLCQAVVLLPDAVSRASALIAHATTFLGMSTGPLLDLVHAVSVELDETATAHPRYESLRRRLRARSPSTLYGDPAATEETVVAVLGADTERRIDSATEREELAVLLNSAIRSGVLGADRVGEVGASIIAREPARAEHVFGVVPLVIVSLLIADRTDGLRSWLAAAQQDAQQANLPFARLLIHLEQAFVLMARGRLVLARVHVDAADRLVTPGYSPAENLVGFALGLIGIQSQDRELCESVLRRRHSHLDDPVLSAGQLLLRGAVSAMRGEWHAALQSYQSCGRALRAGGWHNSGVLPWATGVVEMYRRLGNVQGALAVLDEEQDRVSGWGSPVAVGRLLRLRANLTEGGEGVALLRQSAQVLRGSANQLELCRTLARLGDRLDDDAIRAEARTLGRRCGLPASAMPGPATKGTGELPELTRTEHRVVTLAVSGLSNQNIADELSVSLRAVEKHLTRSYRKLQINGRAGLSAEPGE